MSSIYSIYKATNTINGKVYIGFDSNWPRRKSVHKSLSKNPTQKFHKALKKYGWNNFNWEILYQSKNGEYCLSVMEPYFIDENNSFNDGYNMTLGGEGTFGKKSWLGKKHTKESKRKISESNSGKIRTKEHSENISKSKLGKKIKPFTDEHKKKISESHKGKKPFEMTKEIAQKISKSLSGGNHYSAKPVNINGIVYSCKKEAIQKLGINSYQLNKLLTTNLA